MALKTEKVSQRTQNASFTGDSGALGGGDRGAFQATTVNDGNPYNSTDYMRRWREYVRLYQTSWEARKIIRIIPEDALRKTWIAEDIPEEIAKGIQTRLDQLQFPKILLRSLILERLLGGCFSFFGLEDNKDEPSKLYKAKEGRRLRFINAIPISRISQVTWETDPLSEHYMRPTEFRINAEVVHVSRGLLWDGDPLIDPQDFYLQQFRANLAGFGPSKLSPIWDDINKAVGTRQAAYQLIQVNNAIIAAVQGLSDLGGTTPGKLALEKVKEVANQLSVYRAAVIDGEKVDVKSHSASFGSVPELILTFIQILSAASDIPATRFLGQAPGGLNATGDSDLENYYNMIDSYQRQKIEPALRRTYDVIGYQMFNRAWAKEREKLTFKFPPLWNLNELEEAQTNQMNINNALMLYEQNLISEEKVIEEINAKGALTVTLDETDIGMLDDFGSDLELEPTAARPAIPSASAARRLESPQPIRDTSKKAGVRTLNALASLVPEGYDPEEWKMGMEAELEHKDVTGGNEILTAKIVKAHLDEDPRYYTKLKEVEGKTENKLDLAALPIPTQAQIESGNYKKHHIKLQGLPISIENVKGSARSGVDARGQAWSVEMPAHYGYVKRTEGADGDQLDVYIGDDEESNVVYVVKQHDADSNEFDEFKCIFGITSKAKAKELYLKGFSDGRGEDRLGCMIPMSMDDFKEWIAEGMPDFD